MRHKTTLIRGLRWLKATSLYTTLIVLFACTVTRSACTEDKVCVGSWCNVALEGFITWRERETEVGERGLVGVFGLGPEYCIM